MAENMDSDTSVTYRYEGAISADQLRILTLEPSPDFEADIKCKLNVFQRDDHPRYTALSYWWGRKDQGTVNIKIEDSTLQIGEELATALRHLRREKEPRSLWTDAICIIQQGHLQERDKNNQIFNMDRTYSEASDVLIWLGDSETEQSSLAMAAIDRLGAQLDDLILDDVPKANIILPLVNGREPREYILAIGKLLNRPWFHRLWTLQEVCLAPRGLTVMCGHDEVPFWKLLHLQIHPTVLHLAIQHHAPFAGAEERHRMLARGREPSVGLTRQYFLANRKAKELHSTTHDKETQAQVEQLEKTKKLDGTKLSAMTNTLLGHLWTFRNRECTMDEDRVYALLGMSCDIPKYEIPPSVGDPELTFENATIAIIRQHRKLDVLGMCFGPTEKIKRPEERKRPTEKYQRASWVPDLRSDPTSRPLDSLTRYQWPREEIDSPHAFRASKKSLAIFEYHEGDPSELVVKGLQIGVIKDSGYEGSQDWREALLKARNLADGLAADGRDVEEEFWRTLLTNRSTGGRPPLTILEGAQFQLWWNMFLAPTSLSSVQNQMKVWHFTAAFNQHYVIRDFFITDTGLMGLCSPARFIGDVVCLLAGAQVPFVLRPQDGKYRVVGECYVHGAMHGELWDESKLEEFCLY